MNFRRDARRGQRAPAGSTSRRLSRDMARPMSRSRRVDAQSARLPWNGRGRATAPLALAGGALLLVVTVAWVMALPGRTPPPGSPSDDVAAVGSAAGSAHPGLAVTPSIESPSPSTGDGPSPSSTPDPSASARPTLGASPRPTPTPTPTRDPNFAPRNAAQFDLRGQAIDILFPFGTDARYRYRDNFMRRRPGEPVAFNHARVADDGHLIRLHDGIDIYTRPGEAVLAPFSGRVVDPADRWWPWDRLRYGVSVAVISDEPRTSGYAAVMVHLDRARVRAGDRVTRGDVIGMVGVSGNGDDHGIRPHLHLELRAPFRLHWSEVGEDRYVDAFNPFPSLVLADPRR